MAGYLLPSVLLFAAVMPRIEQAPATPIAPARILLTAECVSASRDNIGQFRFQELQQGRRERLASTRIPQEPAQHVEIGGRSKVKRFTIRGGLWPSANIAAQAGALDPAQEAIARQLVGANRPPRPLLAEFRVARVRDVNGACP